MRPTPEQCEILAHDASNHARILAGPGTGKSFTLVSLLAEVTRREEGRSVKLLTFTRAATAELKEKIERSEGAGGLRPSTVHSFSISVLLKNPGSGNFPRPLRIADDWERKKILMPSLSRRSRFSIRRLKELDLWMQANWESLIEAETEIPQSERTRFMGSWEEHRRIMGYTLLQELPFALLKALRQYEVLEGIDIDLLLVDEYQDLNACDLAIVAELARRGCSVIGTGDDDQSIYSWRHGDPSGIRNFPSQYPGCADYSLSVSLRCSRKIIDWANHVISGDPGRPHDRALLKSIKNCPEGDVALLGFPDERQETKGIAELVQGLVNDEGVGAGEILILFRTDHNLTFSNPLRTELERLGISANDANAVESMLNEANNRLAITSFRLAADRGDSVAWAALLQLTRGVGNTFHDYIYFSALPNQRTFAESLLHEYSRDFEGGSKSPSAKAKSTVKETLKCLEALDVPGTRPSNGWGAWMIRESRGIGLRFSPDFADLLRDIDEVVEEGPLGQYLSQIQPLGRDLAQAKSDGIRIMTMVGSKGLTVRATIVAGVEDNLIPRPEGELSEERRILYVAMTRSREYLYCTWAKRRSGPTARAGKATLALRHPSHFLEGGPIESESGTSFLRSRFG